MIDVIDSLLENIQEGKPDWETEAPARFRCVVSVAELVNPEEAVIGNSVCGTIAKIYKARHGG